MSDDVRVTPQAWNPRGEAVIVGSHGKPLMVFGGIPGEEATVWVQHKGRNQSLGLWRHSDTPDPHRVEPPCDRYTACGGCPLMHLDVEGQWMAREALVREALAEHGLDDVTIGARHASPDGLDGYRHVVNEAEVRERVLARGFEAIALEELRFEEQVQVMSEAGVVLGPHGGGMSNTVFCAAGTRVAEIFSQEYVAPWFWFLANITGVDYHYMIDAAAPRPELAERWNLGASMQVDLSKLDRLLDQLDTA